MANCVGMGSLLRFGWRTSCRLANPEIKRKNLMMTELTDHADESIGETPEDVAILYSWANLHGAKYRDFSASRREYRAQVRHRVAEELRQAELAAKAEAETAAGEAERAAREAERAARSVDAQDSGMVREQALRQADDAARRAAAERVEAARRAEAAALAEATARREEREIAEAHASAQRQAASYTNSEVRRRMQAGPQPSALPGLARDPYEQAEHPVAESDLLIPVTRKDYDQQRSGTYSKAEAAPRVEYAQRTEYSHRSSGERRALRVESDVRRRPQGYRPDEASGILPAYLPGGISPAARAGRSMPAVVQDPQPVQSSPQGFGKPVTQEPFEVARQEPAATGRRSLESTAPARQNNSRQEIEMQESVRQQNVRQDNTPAWLYSSNVVPNQSPTPVSSVASARPAAVAETLQHSREQVASRWFALKGVFEPGHDVEEQGVRRRESRPPALAIFSLAGGVGKTSLVATLGRALSSIGEKVLLADTTSHGLLPFYFGASELRTGVVRTFSPPSGLADAPIYMVSYDAEKAASDSAAQAAMMDEMGRSASGTQRVLLDLNPSSGWMIRRLARMHPTVLVPVAADMNSVISLQTVERYFHGLVDSDGRAILPFYVLNHFDASLPLHLDVREVLKRQLGDRLLPFVIRRSAGVSEALAEGMTVVDYTPEAGISEDYMKIAGWIRGIAPASIHSIRTTRWSER